MSPTLAASGAGAGVTLSYAWKSFVDSHLDDVLEAFLLDRTRRPELGPTMAVFSAGAHHFAMHIGHTNQIQWLRFSPATISERAVAYALCCA